MAISNRVLRLRKNLQSVCRSVISKMAPTLTTLFVLKKVPNQVSIQTDY